MSTLLPSRPSDARRGPEPTTTLDPRLGRTYLQAWRLRAAQWKALSIAREVFGPESSARLSRHPWTPCFNGLLHLDVPFNNLGEHAAAEGRFLSAVAQDPVLRTVPLVFVFNPLIAAPAPRCSRSRGIGRDRVRRGEPHP